MHEDLSAPGALFRTKEGAVAFDKDKCIGCKLCVAGCPFDVPRYDAKDKIGNAISAPTGSPKACHRPAPRPARPAHSSSATGTLWSHRRKKRAMPRVYGEADLGGLGTLYAFKDAPKLYGMNEKPAIAESVIFWHKVLKPLSVIGLGGVVAGALIHYALIGPHKDEDEEVKKS